MIYKGRVYRPKNVDFSPRIQQTNKQTQSCKCGKAAAVMPKQKLLSTLSFAQK